MSINFYWKREHDANPDERADPATHIGLSTYFGLYCLQCETGVPRRNPDCVTHDIIQADRFSWAQDPAAVRTRIERDGVGEVMIVDEYGSELTGADFLRMIDKIPAALVRTGSVGEWFS